MQPSEISGARITKIHYKYNVIHMLLSRLAAAVVRRRMLTANCCLVSCAPESFAGEMMNFSFEILKHANEIFKNTPLS